ncbi:MAG TPA: hypothetical protein VMD59_03960, partial [Acidimicrobiales bacterium]|nr:hypothetical protein [Acidimicrobiales bacterium]
RRLPGFDDESAQCRWTSVVELLESARAEGQLLARAFEQGAAVVVRSASGAEEPLPEALQDVLVAAAGAAGGGHAVVLAEVGELVDVRAAAWNLSVSLSSIPSLIERGTLDDFYFEGEHHLPAASVEAYVTLRRAAADRAMAELEAERARRGHEQP